MMRIFNTLRITIILTILFSLNVSGENRVADPDPKRFQNEIDAFNKWDAKNSWPKEAVLFVGSSSIRMWKTHEAFPDFPVINRGFGGAHISDVLYYYNDIVKKYRAPIIVFYAGDNDIAGGKTVVQVYEDYVKFVKMIKKDDFEVKLIYIPIKPSINRWRYWEKMNRVNLKIKEYNDKDENLYYIDLATPLLDASGNPKKDVFIGDGLHLNKKGYALWEKLLSLLLEQLIK